MPSKLVSNLDEAKGITAFTFVANRIIGKNILSHLCVKLALMPARGGGFTWKTIFYLCFRVQEEINVNSDFLNQIVDI